VTSASRKKTVPDSWNFGNKLQTKVQELPESVDAAEIILYESILKLLQSIDREADLIKPFGCSY